MHVGVESDLFKQAMRQVPSPVTVVTAADSQEMRGITIGSFTSISLSPPLISFNIAHDAQAHDLIVRAPRFAVHLLSDQQADLSINFAIPDRSSEEQFEKVSYHLDEAGIPVLEGVLVVFYCKPHAVFSAGDHSLLIGEVVAIADGVPGKPLIYQNKGYHQLG